MIEDLIKEVCNKSRWEEFVVREIIEQFIDDLPRPQMPYDQAALYRNITGMEMEK